MESIHNGFVQMNFLVLVLMSRLLVPVKQLVFHTLSRKNLMTMNQLVAGTWTIMKRQNST